MAFRMPHIPEGELADIEEAARQAAKSVAHLTLVDVDYRTWPCGHRRTTACTADRCTVISQPFMCA